MADQTFLGSVEEFVAASPWLGPEHAPALMTLRAVATKLDGGDVQAALVSQFGLVYRALLGQRPTVEQADPLAEALQEAQQE